MGSGFPPVLWSFPPSASFTCFPTPGCWVCATSAALSCQARLVYLQFYEGFPSSPLHAQGTPPSLLHVFIPSLLRVFIVLIAYYSVLFFTLGGCRSVQGAMLMWPRVVCGNTMYHLAHLVVHVFPSRQGAGIWWQPRGPPHCYVQRKVEMLCTGWRCGGVKVLPLLSGLACKVCLQRLSKILL
jgi:hypothetical protein